MADRVKAELGAVQETLLYGRGWGGRVTVLRTVIFDGWVSDFLTARPGGTVVELGTGLNTRFERVGHPQAHWIDLDLPDTIELRRRFFADSGHRRMLAASVLDQDWMPAVQESPWPYFFVADGVLAYLDQAPQVIARIARTFPGALIAFDTYSQRTLEQQHKLAARKNMDARWAWSCDDPRTLERLAPPLAESCRIRSKEAGLGNRNVALRVAETRTLCSSSPRTAPHRRRMFTFRNGPSDQDALRRKTPDVPTGSAARRDSGQRGRRRRNADTLRLG